LGPGHSFSVSTPPVGGISGDGVVKSGAGGGSPLSTPSASGSSGTTVVHVKLFC